MRYHQRFHYLSTPFSRLDQFQVFSKPFTLFLLSSSPFPSKPSRLGCCCQSFSNMIWQKVDFLLGFVPNVALAAKVPRVPVLPRQTPGISISDNPGQAGGYVVLPQHSSDDGPAVTAIEATLTVPNLTFASGHSSAGAPYQLGVGCSIFATTDGNSKADCNTRGPYVYLNTNVGCHILASRLDLVSLLTDCHS